MYILLFLLLFCTTAWADHSSLRNDTINTLPDSNLSSFRSNSQIMWDHEESDREGDHFAPFVKSGGLHGTSASLTTSALATLAYVPERISQTATAITYIATANDICWLIISSDNNGLVGWTRIGSTAYYFQCEGDTTPNEPTLPVNSTWLSRSTITANAITAVLDLRNTLPGRLDTNTINFSDPIWGIRCNDTTDATIPIQAALNTIRHGTRVQLPQGKPCRISSCLTFPAASFIMEGYGPSESGFRAMTTTPNIDLLCFSATNNGPSVMLRDFALQGPAAGVFGQSGIVSDGANGITVDNMWFRGLLRGVKGITTSFFRSNMAVFEFCNIGLDFQAGPVETMLVNTTFYKNQTDVILNGTAQTFVSTGSTHIGTEFNGFSLVSATGANLSNISAQDDGTGRTPNIILLTSSDENIISNVTSQTGFGGKLLSLVASNRNQISNLVSKGLPTGLLLSTSSNNQLTNLSITNSTVRGIDIDTSANNKITNFNLQGNLVGVRFAAANDTVLVNGTIGTSGTADFVDSGSTGNVWLTNVDAVLTGLSTVARLGTRSANIIELLQKGGGRLRNPHEVIGAVALVAGTATITFTGNEVFSSPGTYRCSANSATAANAVQVDQTAANSVTFNGTGTDAVHYRCVGN